MGVKVGCCGFPRGRVEYYRYFGLVEVQRTFYKLPMTKTARRWREEAPAAFEFALKAWQLITHKPTSPTYRKAKLTIPDEKREAYGAFRLTAEVFSAWKETREIAEALAARIVVFQCPASFTPADEHVRNMRAFFKEVKRGDLIFAWEPRGEKWRDDQIRELCCELDLVHCVDPFVRPPVHGHPAYFRLHGLTGYRYRYTEEDLAQLLERCRQHEEVYCLFNNISMWEDALRFSSFLSL